MILRNIWHFWFFLVRGWRWRGGCCWHPVCRGQKCYWIAYNAQESAPASHHHTQQRIFLPQMSIVWMLRKPASGQVQSCCLRTSLRFKTTPETEVVCSFVPQQHRMHSASWILTIFLLTFCMGWADFAFLSSLSIRESTHTDALMPVHMEAWCWRTALVIESHRSSSAPPVKSSSFLWFK